MSHASAISRFMVSAGAFAVGGTRRTAEEIAALRREMEAVKPLLDQPADKAVMRAVEKICEFGPNDKTLPRLLDALAGRQAAVENANAAAKLAAMAATLPYKDN